MGIVLLVVVALVIVSLAVLLISRRKRGSGLSAAEEIAKLRVATDADATTAVVEDVAVQETTAEKPRFRDRLGKARDAMSMSSLFSRGSIDDNTWNELEERLIRGDVGVRATVSLLDDLKAQAKAGTLTSGESLHDTLRSSLLSSLEGRDRDLCFIEGAPNVWLFVGVNGVGKTTTIGKLAKQQTDSGRSVILAAGDTFRAAAGEQLETWANRASVEVVRGQEGGDPGAVIFDAIERAAAKNIDLVLADTAGRLQNKTNLMNELAKVTRVASREPAKLTEVILVLDATTGQNGLSQAKEFAEIAGITGIALTKLDGTARGGIAFAIETELDIPIKLVGLGEGIDDLVTFDAAEYVAALID